MTKKYLILKLETKESLVPNGYLVATRTEYFGVTESYPVEYESIEQAELNLPNDIYKQYTIIPIYSK